MPWMPYIDGKTATFVWQGCAPAPQLIGDFNNWNVERALMLERRGRGMWTHSLEFPRDAYMEYAFVRGTRRVPDPLNPRTVDTGLGSVNHYFYMPDAAPTPWARPRRDVPTGTLTRHSLPTQRLLVGKTRRAYLYQPPAREPAPLVVVLDGWDYLKRGRLKVIVENLSADGRIRPLALAFLDHAGPARAVEYHCSETLVAFMHHVLLPFAQRELNLIDIQAEPGAFGVLGASSGGLGALFIALRLPQIFGKVLSQSGAFAPHGLESVVMDLVRATRVPLKIWMDAGRYEWLLDSNRRLHALLKKRRYDVTYREFDAGHNFTAWRNDLPHGLVQLFGRGE